jgi:predicted RNase H-like nuclease (RuvC/YqgF family)
MYRSDFFDLTGNDYSSSVISTGGNARDLNARTSRAEYEDYKKRFQPIENELNSLILDKDKRKAWHQNIIDYGNNNVISAYNRARNNIDRSKERYGNVISADENKYNDRKLALQRANTQSQALTNAGDYIRREDLNLLLGNSTAQKTVE